MSYLRLRLKLACILIIYRLTYLFKPKNKTIMKKIAVLLLLSFFCLSMTYAKDKIQCKAITKEGKQCTRMAVINGFCKQHYSIANSPKVLSAPKVDLPEEWTAISQDPKDPDHMSAWRDPKTNIVYITFKTK